MVVLMMRLRAECIKFGGEQLPKVSSCGAPKFQIPKSVLENLLNEGFSTNEISTLLCISESTVYRRMRTFGLSKLAFSEISDDDLGQQEMSLGGYSYPLHVYTAFIIWY